MCVSILRTASIRPSSAKYKAIANMWDVLQALYCTCYGPNLLNFAAAARHFRRHCTIGTASRYLVSLEHDVHAMLHNIWPFGLAMVCGDISESINRFLKYGHNKDSNGGGGGLGGGVDEVSGRNGRPSTGRAVCRHNVSLGFLHISMCHGLCTGGHGRKFHGGARMPWR